MPWLQRVARAPLPRWLGPMVRIGLFGLCLPPALILTGALQLCISLNVHRLMHSALLWMATVS